MATVQFTVEVVSDDGNVIGDANFELAGKCGGGEAAGGYVREVDMVPK